MFQRKVRVKGQIQIFYKKVIVFKIKQQPQVKQDSGPQDNPMTATGVT